MNRTKHIIGALFAGVALLSSCSDEVVPSISQGGKVEDMILFSAGNESMKGVTRVASTLYMPNGVRFVVDMYYQEAAHYNLTPWQAFMQVDQNNLGNSNYLSSEYTPVTDETKDDYNNDKTSTIFYWQNRQNHIFIGYVDNYNAAYASATAASQTYIPDGLNTHKEYPIIQNKEVVRNQECKHFDLRNPDKNGDGKPDWTKMTDQYDPLIACTEQQPHGNSSETNRVYLTFKHQFAQVRVNLRGGEGVNLTADQIDGVEMLGVSESADVFPFVDHRDKVEPVAPESPENEEAPTTPKEQEIVMYGDGTSYIRTAEPGVVYLTKYTEEQLKENEFGTSFNMFEADKVADEEYIKTYEAIAYGQLPALRIRWHEMTKDEGGQDVPGVEHVITFKITEQNGVDFNTLLSGKRFIYNLEIRRGTLAVVRTVIDDWETYQQVYEEDGTISEN